MPCPYAVSFRSSHRRSIRLPRFNYRDSGYYFVTIVAFRRLTIFGRVAHGEAVPSKLGTMVFESWRNIPKHVPTVGVDAVTLMPNHLHGIIVIRKGAPGPVQAERFGRPTALSLPTIIRSFKAATSRTARLEHGLTHPLWQRGYYEHVVRRDDELDRIRQYIEDNPVQWELDRENPNSALRPKRYAWEP